MGINIKRLGPNRFYLNVRARRPGGGEDRIRETFEGTRDEAVERFISLRRKIKEEQSARCRFETFGDLLRFFEERRNGLPYREKCLADGLGSALGDVPLTTFPARLEAYIAHLRRHPSPKTGRPLANGSINRMLALVRAAFNQAVHSEILDRNPITVSRFPKLKETARDVVLSEAELTRLLNIIGRAAPHLLAITLFASQVPSRLSELTGARRSELDLFRMTLRIPPMRSKSGRGILKPWPPVLREYALRLPAGTEWVFYREKRGKFHPLGDFKNSWKRCCRLAGLDGFQFRDLRHQAATAMLNRGVPTVAVQQVGGWQSPRMLSEKYYHPDAALALKNVSFPEGVRTVAADTSESEGGKEAVG